MPRRSKGLPYTSGPFSSMWSASKTGHFVVETIQEVFQMVDRPAVPFLDFKHRMLRPYPENGTFFNGPWLVSAMQLLEPEIPNLNEPFGRVYDPLAEPNLHRRFAKVEQAAPGITAFADNYGLLGDGFAVRLSDGSLHMGEPLGFWVWQIELIRELLRMWDLVKAARAGLLGEYVHWIGPSELIVEWPGVVRWTVPTEYIDGYQCKFGQVLVPARLYVYEVLNRYLCHASPVLLPESDGRITIMPYGLLINFYILFAKELSGLQRPALECLGCGSQFIPATARQKYCEEACRKQHWDRKKRRRAKGPPIVSQVDK